jgi:hypothetical protein
MLYLTRADPDANHLVPKEEQVPVGPSSTSPTPATALETLLSFMPNDSLRAEGYASRIRPTPRWRAHRSWTAAACSSST